MEVQTYELIEAPAHLQGAELDEAIRLVDSLGLEKQIPFVIPDDGVAACPYRKMTKEEATVFGAICPTRCKIENYEDSPIPLRILQVASHAREFFDFLFIWYPENADIKDPVLVGVNGSEWSGERYLLARWGEVLETFDRLRELAGQIIRAKRMNSLRTVIAEATSALNDVENMSAFELVVDGRTSASFYQGS